MNTSYSLLGFAGIATALLAGGVISKYSYHASEYDNRAQRQLLDPVAGEQVSVNRVAFPEVHENSPDKRATDLPKVAPLDRQSIYQRALASPTGMLPTSESLDLFQQRILENPQDYASWMVLGRLYMRQAEETDNFRDLVNAENSFDSSLSIQPNHVGSLTFKAIVQNKQHKFKSAYQTASKALMLKPGNFTALAEMGDAQLLLGNVNEAEDLYQQLHRIAETPGSYARLARLAEIQGDLELAEKNLKAAVEKAHDFSQEPKEIAWYHWRLAELAWNQNQWERCEQELAVVFENHPQDAAALVTQAKLLAAKGKIQQAVQSIQALVDRDPAPPTLAFLGDLYALSDDMKKAKQYWERAKESMAEEATFAGEAHLRERALFLLDHDLELKSALEMAVTDLENRRDLYAHDAAAWAHYKNGNLKKAVEEIEVALKSGSQDPLLHFHAMKIYTATEDVAKAKAATDRLHDSNPQFQPWLTRSEPQLVSTR